MPAVLGLDEMIGMLSYERVEVKVGLEQVAGRFWWRSERFVGEY
jgi:hypothetical protein